MQLGTLCAPAVYPKVPCPTALCKRTVAIHTLTQTRLDMLRGKSSFGSGGAFASYAIGATPLEGSRISKRIRSTLCASWIPDDAAGVPEPPRVPLDGRRVSESTSTRPGHLVALVVHRPAVDQYVVGEVHPRTVLLLPSLYDALRARAPRRQPVGHGQHTGH